MDSAERREKTVPRRRWRRAVLLTVLLTLLAVIAIGGPVYLKPQADPMRKADAIFVLGGASYERYAYGIELALEGWAPHLVLSNPDGEADLWLSDLCAHQRYPFDVSCAHPDPRTTRGEARELERMAEENNWDSVIVVTFTPHISRARWILERCYDGELIMSESPSVKGFAYWVNNYIYQTAGYIRAALQRGC
ncbi:YdcF family protein [Aldersonia kunmingensis]|uniref:YdcF family protein n=1 Tax=Aldersonia kunmingensis TaxID=408066 RepID=UPI000A729868|nr:YdcF family protein [Aldersonia kunmingensis]